MADDNNFNGGLDDENDELDLTGDDAEETENEEDVDDLGDDEDGDDFPCASVRDVMCNTEVFNFDVKLHVVPSVRHPSYISVGGNHVGSLQSFTAQVASSPNIFITESSVFSDAGDNNDEDSMENIAMLPVGVKCELLDWMRDDMLGR